jgi:hypothetical protein
VYVWRPDGAHLRDIALELRDLASRCQFPRARLELRDLAVQFERRADHLDDVTEQRSGAPDRPQPGEQRGFNRENSAMTACVKRDFRGRSHVLAEYDQVERAVTGTAVGIEGLYPHTLVISEWGPWIRARAAAQRHGYLPGWFGGNTGAADGGPKGAVADITGEEDLVTRIPRMVPHFAVK